MAEKFFIYIETFHADDIGDQENVSRVNQLTDVVFLLLFLSTSLYTTLQRICHYVICLLAKKYKIFNLNYKIKKLFECKMSIQKYDLLCKFVIITTYPPSRYWTHHLLDQNFFIKKNIYNF